MPLIAKKPTQELVDIVGALGGTWTGYIAMCRCPAHNDSDPSLSVRQGDRGILVTCFAGCAREDVLRELGRVRPGRHYHAPEPTNPQRAANIERLYWDQVGRRINVQERLDGVPVRAILDRAGEDGAGQGAADVAGRYADAVLRMIIFNGRFHADPHPGNVFVLADGSLAFIDFGAVGVLSPARRNEVVTLVLAIAGEDTRSVTDVLLQWSGETDVDRPALTRDLDALIDQFRGAVLQQIELADIFGRVFALLRTYRLALPPDLALLLRTLLIAEGFVRRLDPGFDITARAAPIARELLRERIGPAGLKRGGRRLATSLGRLAAASPELVAFAERVARSGALPIELQKGAVSSPPALPRGADPNVLSAGLLVAGAILQHDHDVVGAILMASAILLAGCAWYANRQRR